MSEPHARADQILAAARDAFAENGYDATSMAEIARRVGVVEGAIYRHVPSKVELLTRVIAAFYEPLIESVTSGLTGIDAPADRVRYLINRQVRAMADEPLVCRLIVSEARALDTHRDSTVARLNRRYTGLALDAIREGGERGEFRTDIEPATGRDLIYGSIEHICWPMLNGQADVDVEQAAREVTALVLAALAPTDAPPAPAATSARLEAQIARLEAAADRLAPLD